MRTNTYGSHRRAKAAKVTANWYEKIANSVAWVVCTIAIIYQSYDVTNRYLRYDTTSQIEIFTPDVITVPKLFIGFSADQLTKANKTRNDDLYYTDRFFYDFYYSPAVEDAIVDCSFGQANSIRTKACPLSQLEKSTKNGHVYYAARLVSAKAFDRTWAWGEKELYKIIFSEQFMNITNIKVILQATLQDPFGSDVNIYDYQSPAPEFSAVSFHYTHLQQYLLPSPYDSDCFDYENIGYISQGHCLEACLNVGYLFNLNMTNSRTFWSEQNMDQRLNLTTQWFNCTDNDSDEETFQMECESELQYKCSQSCSRPDCFKEVFVPIEETYDDSDAWEVVLLPPKMQSERTRRVPRMDLIDFLSELLAIVGFWIGFSPYGILESLIPAAASALSNIKTVVKSDDMLAFEAKAEARKQASLAQLGAYINWLADLDAYNDFCTVEKRWLYDSSVPFDEPPFRNRFNTI